MVVYLCLAVLVIILRVISHLHFSGALAAFYIDVRKEIVTKADVNKLKNGTLRKIIADYITTSDRTKSPPTRQIVERVIAKKSLLGWRYNNLIPFIENMENGLLLVGLVLVLTFSNYAFVFGTITAGVFALTRLCMAFFNARAAKELLTDEIHIFIEREISRFFVPDTTTSATGFDKKAIEDLGHIISTTMSTVTDNIKEATTAIAPAIVEAMEGKLLEIGTAGQEMNQAAQSITTATENMDRSIQNLCKTTEKLTSASDLLATHMQGHSGALSTQLLTLVEAIAAVKEAVSHFETQQEALAAQAKYIERNQQTLDATILNYEESLQSLSQTLGEGIGAFINLHAQTSAQTINDALRGNIEKMTNLTYAQAGNSHACAAGGIYDRIGDTGAASQTPPAN